LAMSVCFNNAGEGMAISGLIEQWRPSGLVSPCGDTRKRTGASSSSQSIRDAVSSVGMCRYDGFDNYYPLIPTSTLSNPPRTRAVL
jgi:hypothetical protein